MALAVLACFSGAAHAGTFAAFGPEDFARSAGKPVTEVRSFTVSNPQTRYLLVLNNGGADNQFRRVSSAVVTLNGAVIVAPSEFNQGVALIEKEIAVEAGNELTVEVRSSPGSGFTLTILGDLLEVNIDSPARGLVTAAATVDLTGTVTGAVSVEVNGVVAVIEAGRFTALNLPLTEGTNRLVATAENAIGEAASTSITVRRDTTPPLVVIESPRNGDRLVSEVVTIAGTVNDIIPGATVNEDDVTVTVNGLPAAVNNRTFFLPNLPLTLGSNTITVSAVDRAGNQRSSSIAVTREADLAGLRLLIVGGNNQAGPIGSTLPTPLSLRVETKAGLPVVGRPVTFSVSRGDGLLTVPAGSSRSRTLLTDANGLAVVDFQLGSRTGEGFHRVRVTTPGSLSFAEFCATAGTGAPVTLSVAGMPPARGQIGRPLEDPIAVILTDGGGNPVRNVDITFQVNLGGGNLGGSSTRVARTNADGIAEVSWTLGPSAGTANQEASASFAGNPGLPVTFVASAFATGPVAETRVSGVVQDSAGRPIRGARAVLRGTSKEAITGPDGRFTIFGVRPGGYRVAILGGSANDPSRGIFFPDIEFAIEALPGVDNELDQLVVLPFLDMAGAKLVGGAQDVVLEMEGVPGFGIKIFANSVILPDGTRGQLMMSSSQVKFDKVPMPPPQGSTPLVVGTLQPGGIHLDPPAQVVYPNVEGLAPGDVADIFAFHHDIGQFVNIGPGTVSEDGSVVASDPGFGIVQSGWHCLIRLPGPAANCANDCGAQVEWQAIKADGSLGPVMTEAPVVLVPGDAEAGKAQVKVTFSPGGGSFDSQQWTGGDPIVTRSAESASGTIARVTLESQMSGETTVTSPLYRIPVPDEADKTCQAEVEVTDCTVELAGLFHPAEDAVELPEVNDLSELPVADQVAHRTIQLKFSPASTTAGKMVQWTFTPDPMVTTRGMLPAAHNMNLEQEPGFSFNAGNMQSAINDMGIVAVRVNMPPIAFNKGRLKVELVDNPECFKEVDFEVPGVVVIDPGHGGTAAVGGSSANNATSFSGVLEKTMALTMAQLVAGSLNGSDRNIQVVLTRTGDVNLGLAARANVGRDNGADVFLSIHYNGFNATARGTETLIRPAGNDQVNHGEDSTLAGVVNGAVLSVMPGPNRGVRDQELGVLRDSSLGNTAAFHTTRACLAEIDFIDVMAVDVLLNTGPNAATTRQSIADAIAEEIENDLENQP